MIATTSIVADSVGTLLRQAREEAGFDTATIALRTKIPERYILLFEEGAHEKLSDDVYTKIFLKGYGKFLGFDTKTLLELFRNERGRITAKEKNFLPQKQHPTSSLSLDHFFITPKRIQAAILLSLVFSLMMYFGMEVKKIIAPPSLSLRSPQEGFVTTEHQVTVNGVTEKEVTLRINGKNVSADINGNFKDTLDLQEGLNVLTIIGAKKYSKEKMITRRIIVLPKDRPTATLRDSSHGL